MSQNVATLLVLFLTCCCITNTLAHEALSMTLTSAQAYGCEPYAINGTLLIRIAPTDEMSFSCSCGAGITCEDQASNTFTDLIRFPQKTAIIEVNCSATTFSGDGEMVQMDLGNLSLFAAHPKDTLWPAYFSSNCNSSCTNLTGDPACTCEGCGPDKHDSSCPAALDELYVFPAQWMPLSGPCIIYPGGSCSLGSQKLVVPMALRDRAFFLGNLRMSSGCSASRSMSGRRKVGNSGQFGVSCIIL